MRAAHQTGWTALVALLLQGLKAGADLDNQRGVWRGYAVAGSATARYAELPWDPARTKAATPL
jgi:hypothetical protein